MAQPEALKNESNTQLYLRLLSYAKPYWRMLALGLFLSAIAAAMEPFLPALMKPLIDNGFAPKGDDIKDSIVRDTPWMVPLIIVGIMTLRGLVTLGANYAMAWVQIRLICDVRREMFSHLLTLPSSHFENNASARLITRITNDVNSIGTAATSAGIVLVRESLTIVGLLAYLLYINWRLTLITLTVAPFIAWVTRLVGLRLRGMSRGLQSGMGRMTHTLQEAINCQKVLKVFGGEDQESVRFAKVNDEMRGYANRSALAAAAGSPLVHFFVAIAVGTVVYAALIEAAQNKASVGTFVSFITAMLMLLAPLRALAGVNVQIQRGLAGAESVFEFMDIPPELDKGSYSPELVVGKIEFRDVSLQYIGKDFPALDKVNLLIEPGEVVAIVGPSGGGKSSLASLIPRFHLATEGEILVDGINVENYGIKSLRSHIALVSQETMLFDDTLAANIAYGARSSATLAEIEGAAKAANAWEFIEKLPEGLKTKIGENGSRLSGGQRQRIAIARAILKDAPILILDEATSALDSESERLVQEALNNLVKGRTTLIIAHRLSTIEQADKIVVMVNGNIREVGSHHQLLENNHLYAKLWQAQRSDL